MAVEAAIVTEVVALAVVIAGLVVIVDELEPDFRGDRPSKLFSCDRGS
jgi:hypothetical protein